jgi:hypothetical protein
MENREMVQVQGHGITQSYGSDIHYVFDSCWGKLYSFPINRAQLKQWAESRTPQRARNKRSAVRTLQNKEPL